MTVINMDCIEGMRLFPDNSFDSIVTDPPYGIRFMGKSWDGADIEARVATRRAMKSHAPDAGPNGGHKSIAAEAGRYDTKPSAMRAFQEFSEEWALEALRVLKPGGYLLSFASPRSYHRMVTGIEDAGFEIRDQILWVFSSGFPKSHNLTGDRQGWGTALKPAHEPIVVARKALIGTVAANVLAWGTGAINVGGCRVGTEIITTQAKGQAASVAGRAGADSSGSHKWNGCEASEHAGRWPANLIHDGSDEVLAAFPQAPGQMATASTSDTQRAGQNVYGSMVRGSNGSEPRVELDKSAARFFYCAKASKADRSEGNTHPTVKPTDLMRYLCRLVTPPGGIVLDPFTGSGSTGKAATLEGFGFIGFELSPEYTAIATARIEGARK